MMTFISLLCGGESSAFFCSGTTSLPPPPHPTPPLARLDELCGGILIAEYGRKRWFHAALLYWIWSPIAVLSHPCAPAACTCHYTDDIYISPTRVALAVDMVVK